MKEILIIGCGSIGALYDINGSNINTHAKALDKNAEYHVSIFDNNSDNIKQTLQRFNFTHLKELHYNFDVIIIATPTPSHFEFLKEAIHNKTPIVICEKPISLSEDELNELEVIYKQGNSKIFVNYIRQFLPEYDKLKQLINENNNNSLTKICISYTRGVINNCSHAFNLLQFLLGKLEFSDYTLNGKLAYELKGDPTISMNLLINNTPCIINGLPHIKYNFFEIELFFEKSYIKISNSGNKITYSAIKDDEYHDAYKQNLTQLNVFDNDTILNDYMLKVINTILKAKSDNFINSLSLNKKLIKLISDVETRN